MAYSCQMRGLTPLTRKQVDTPELRDVCAAVVWIAGEKKLGSSRLGETKEVRA